MKIKKSITAVLIVLVVFLVTGLMISTVLAQENSNGLQTNGKNSVNGNGNSQQGLMQQQNRSQNNVQNECNGECEDCAENNINENAFQQQKNNNNQNQGNQNKIGCTGDCDSCNLENQNEGQVQFQTQAQNRDMAQSQEGINNKVREGNASLADCEFSYEIKGQELKTMTIEQIAEKWEINSNILLNGIIDTFGLKGSYNDENLLDDLRQEYRFRPAEIKMIAETIKSSI